MTGILENYLVTYRLWQNLSGGERDRVRDGVLNSHLEGHKYVFLGRMEQLTIPIPYDRIVSRWHGWLRINESGELVYWDISINGSIVTDTKKIKRDIQEGRAFAVLFPSDLRSTEERATISFGYEVMSAQETPDKFPILHFDLELILSRK